MIHLITVGKMVSTQPPDRRITSTDDPVLRRSVQAFSTTLGLELAMRREKGEVVRVSGYK